ncbi:MAG: hypothetical protein EU536_01390 [Promethearchaeota archaeon]|nr:MAG: hypothetical protein EU536_01390 [Candidatus Lokiarchaeota archaeon]
MSFIQLPTLLGSLEIKKYSNIHFLPMTSSFDPIIGIILAILSAFMFTGGAVLQKMVIMVGVVFLSRIQAELKKSLKRHPI